MTTLMDIKHLQSRACRVEVCQMHGIAMPVARSIKQSAVIVKCCRAPNDLVASVTVDITDGEVVVAITEERSAAAPACRRSSGIG